jgi:hypothetical protein
MEDPLIVEREELLEMIRELEELYAGLQDVEARVPKYRMRQLEKLRWKVEKSRSHAALKEGWAMARVILKAAAVEVIRWWFGTRS